MVDPHLDKITRHLWRPVAGQAPMKVYALVDAARSEAMYPRIMGAQEESVCLHRGKMAEELAWVAPYLVRLQREEPFTQWLIDNGWGNSQCVFVRSWASFTQLKRHFQTFLKVYDEEGHSFFFRFYDPRVMRVYLPTCNADEIKIVFGKVESFVLEDQEPSFLLAFSQENDNLQTEKTTLE